MTRPEHYLSLYAEETIHYDNIPSPISLHICAFLLNATVYNLVWQWIRYLVVTMKQEKLSMYALHCDKKVNNLKQYEILIHLCEMAY